MSPSSTRITGKPAAVKLCARCLATTRTRAYVCKGSSIVAHQADCECRALADGVQAHRDVNPRDEGYQELEEVDGEGTESTGNLGIPFIHTRALAGYQARYPAFLTFWC